MPRDDAAKDDGAPPSESLGSAAEESAASQTNGARSVP